MAPNTSNEETPRTTNPIPAEIIDGGDCESEKHLTLAWQEEQYSARHEQPCDEEGYDCPEFDDDD